MKLAVNKVKTNPDNPRTIKDDNFRKLVQSIKEFPEMAELRPIVVNQDNVILGGNMRYRAMKEAGWKDIPVKVAKLTPEQEQEFIIKDNVSGGDWDWDLLANQYELEDLELWGLELPVNMQVEEVEEDEAPEVEEEVYSELGKIYQLGKHRVMCGDSTDKANVELLTNGEKADMVFTDPPYGIDLDTDYKKIYGGGSPLPNRTNHTAHNLANGKVIGDDQPFDPSNLLETFSETEEVFIWGCNYFWEKLPNSLDSAVVVWDKRVTDSLAKMQGSEFEMCWSKQKHQQKVARITWAGAYGSDEGKAGHKRVHPTQKPVKIVDFFLSNWGKNTSLVVDPFLGSGSTLIACEQTDRTCYGMELDPKYVDVIRKRYAKFVHPDTWEERWQELTPEVV